MSLFLTLKRCCVAAGVAAIGALCGMAPAQPDTKLEIRVKDFSSEFNSERGASGTYARAAANLVDGDTAGTVWEVHNLQNDPKTTWVWVTFDLGREVKPTYVKVFPVPMSQDTYMAALRPRMMYVGTAAEAGYQAPLPGTAQAGVNVITQAVVIHPEEDSTVIPLSPAGNVRFLRVMFPPNPEGNASIMLSEIEVYADVPEVSAQPAFRSTPYSRQTFEEQLAAEGYAIVYARSNKVNRCKVFEKEILLSGELKRTLNGKTILFFDAHAEIETAREMNIWMLPTIVVVNADGTKRSFTYEDQSTIEQLKAFFQALPAIRNTGHTGHGL